MHRILAALNLAFNRLDKALYHQERALELSPNYDLVVVQHGEVLTWLGRPAEGIEWIRKAMRINPYHPERFWNHLGRAQFVARAYGDAIQSFTRITKPDHTHFAFLAAAAAQMGDAGTASGYAREVISRAPEFTVSAYLATLHYRNDVRSRASPGRIAEGRTARLSGTTSAAPPPRGRARAPRGSR